MWNGPSTVAGVAAASKRWFICTTSMREAEHVGGEDELLALLVADLAGALEPLDRGHPLGLGEPHLAGEVVEVLHQPGEQLAGALVVGGAPPLLRELGDVVLGDQLHGPAFRQLAGEGVGVDRAVVEVDGEEDVVGDRVPQLLGQLADQPRGPGQQREAAQQLQRQVEVGERGAADAGAVERQRLPEHLRVHPADRLEQREVRTELPLLAGDLEQPRRARVAVLVHVVAQAGDEEPGLALAAYDVERDRVPARVVGG